MIAGTETLARLTRMVPAYAEIFEQLGIDYCCGGEVTLEQACRRKRMDLETVLKLLAVVAEHSEESDVDPEAMTIAELCDHIEREHHAALEGELPRLQLLARRVAEAHGSEDPHLKRLQELIEILRWGLSRAMTTEQAALFPLIRRLAGDAAGSGGQGDEAWREVLRTVERDHLSIGHILALVRELTSDFTPPDDACETLMALYAGLWKLEQNMRQYVHKERNVLFPRALAVI